MTPTRNLLFEEAELPRARDPVLYICHKAEGIEIEQRRDDGYIDATAMCRAYGKFFANYQAVEGHKEVFTELERFLNIGIPIIRSEPGRHGGTWIHPQLAVHLATWLSPQFCVRVMGWVLQWMQGRQPVIHKSDVEPFAIGRLVQDVQETRAMVSRILDNTAHIDQNTENTAVEIKEMHVDLWRVIGQELPKEPKQPVPPPPSRSGRPQLARPREEYQGPPKPNWRAAK